MPAANFGIWGGGGLIIFHRGRNVHQEGFCAFAWDLAPVCGVPLPLQGSFSILYPLSEHDCSHL